MRRSRQMSESIELGIVLALAGGFMDAYSYMCRDGVFANAQTGNMLLLGINLSERNWGMALRYLFPVLAFAIGIALADVVRMHAKDKSLFHWRQLSVLCEALVLFVVCFFSTEHESGSQQSDFTGMWHTGGELPEDSWKRNCNHDVHRKLKKRDTELV